MGIAWFDEAPPPMEEPALRTGGAPLLPEGEAWPTCPRCEMPMLFRAQLPLALTGLVGFDDDRLVSVFECHARLDAEPCEEGAVIVRSAAQLKPRMAPDTQGFTIVLHELGSRPGPVLRTVASIADAEQTIDDADLPAVILWGAPPSIANETVRAIADQGGRAELLPHPPTQLARCVGGKLVPYDDDVPGTHRTTLPPLRELVGSQETGMMRGLFGGNFPGDTQGIAPCTCGRNRKTVVRLFAHRDRDPSGAHLGPASVQVCLRCGSGNLLRSGGLPPKRS